MRRPRPAVPGPAVETDRTGSDDENMAPTPHQSARLLLRKTAKDSPRASRTSIINSISTMAAVANRPDPTAEPDHLSAVEPVKPDGGPIDDDEIENRQEMDDDTAIFSASLVDGELADDLGVGTVRRIKTTYTREEKLDAIDRYHRLVTQAAAVKSQPGGPKPNRPTRVTIMDGARMAGVEYQTFRNWLRAEDEIRNQPYGSKNAKRGRRSSQFGTGASPADDANMDDPSGRAAAGDQDDDDMTDAPAGDGGAGGKSKTDESESAAATPTSRVRRPGPRSSLTQTKPGARVDKRTHGRASIGRPATRAEAGPAHQPGSACPSSQVGRALSTCSSSRSSGEPDRLGFDGVVVASSVDQHSTVSAGSQVRLCRVRTSIIGGGADVEGSSVVCSVIGRPEHVSVSDGPDDAADEGGSDRGALVGPDDGIVTRVGRSDVSHASIEGHVRLINCTIKNSRIVGQLPPSGDSPSVSPLSRLPSGSKDVFVLSNCRIENATVVGLSGMVFDSRVLQDGVFGSPEKRPIDESISS